MTELDPVEAMRQMAREVLREALPEILAQAAARPTHSNGHPHANGHTAAATPNPPAATPQVPPPPVAAILRPSTWTGPAIPGEVIGDGGATAIQSEPPAPQDRDPNPDPNTEPVTIDTDEDLARFVRALLARLESPRDRRAIRSGRVRFTLGRTTATKATQTTHHTQTTQATKATKATLRITKGAVTERAVRDAAERGVTLILARGAVLTPLARDQARALGVEIEKEGRC
jgi:hypothetical protein